MRCKSFLKVHKNTGKNMFTKYLSAEDCFAKTMILLTAMIRRYYLFPDVRALAFTRQPMKRNFTWSTRAIDLHSNSAFLSRLKFWFAIKLKMNLRIPRQKGDFANYRDHAKILVVFNKWCNCLILYESCCLHNWPTLRGEKQTNSN